MKPDLIRINRERMERGYRRASLALLPIVVALAMLYAALIILR